MNKILLSIPALLLLLGVTAIGSPVLKEEKITAPIFGSVSLYYQSPDARQVVLFISGDGGWNLGVVEMARSLASLDAIVVGIDIVHYLKYLDSAKIKCIYTAGDLEMLSKFVQHYLKFKEYVTPVLVGYSSGATLVYATLAQSPSTTFAGGISMGFCPDMAANKHFCHGSGLEWKQGTKLNEAIFLPDEKLEIPWIVLHGTVDQVCDFKSAAEFVRKTGDGTIVLLPKVGHGFSVEKNWLPQFNDAFKTILLKQAPSVTASPAEISDLPVVEMPAQNKAQGIMAVHITGDGGWGVTDKGIAQSLSKQGIATVGLNALRYFWKKRTPEETSRDIGRIISHYRTQWKAGKVIFIGMSFGADVLPFVYTRLPKELRDSIVQCVLIGPSTKADFEFHISGWFGGSPSTDYFTLPEIKKMAGVPLLCFYGTDDEETIGPELVKEGVKVVPMEGGHRVGKNFDPIVQQILSGVSKR